MKFKILMMALVLVTAIAANAQPGGGKRGGDPVQRAEMQTKMMVDSLSLSAPQTEKVKEINLKFAQKQQEVRANTPEGEWDKMRAASEALRNEQNAELKTVLSSEQYDRWGKLAEQMRPGRGKGGAAPPESAAGKGDKENKGDKEGKGKKGKKEKKESTPAPTTAPTPEKEGRSN